jgi:hypothetical protein
MMVSQIAKHGRVSELTRTSPGGEVQSGELLAPPQLSLSPPFGFRHADAAVYRGGSDSEPPGQLIGGSSGALG